MPTRPTGTVTFLFTDIESSRGFGFKTAGDAFCAALAAAWEAGRAITLDAAVEYALGGNAE